MGVLPPKPNPKNVLKISIYSALGNGPKTSNLTNPGSDVATCNPMLRHSSYIGLECSVNSLDASSCKQ